MAWPYILKLVIIVTKTRKNVSNHFLRDQAMFSMEFKFYLFYLIFNYFFFNGLGRKDNDQEIIMESVHHLLEKIMEDAVLK